ncbi:BON domain-containing protein [Paracoccus sp. TK19116]|uniref:BON domain-containing protein n=1 Tax=Paracoccus albicereus TaxID=2922394 RepID=A0ABT1MQ71_9RHOB|nr:BON domain-containing protein [Paracoccus albicereus]MCQ0970462.1 BON domain-containing protein [Paracoccus albicereus]
MARYDENDRNWDQRMQQDDRQRSRGQGGYGYDDDRGGRSGNRYDVGYGDGGRFGDASGQGASGGYDDDMRRGSSAGYGQDDWSGGREDRFGIRGDRSRGRDVYGMGSSYEARYGSADIGQYGDGGDMRQAGSYGGTRGDYEGMYRGSHLWQDDGRQGNDRVGRNSQSGEHRGRGPKGYARSDERIREDVCDHLSDDGSLDASDIEVEVSDSEVTLSGHVESRRDKRRAEDCADAVSGVRHVQNNLRTKDSQGAGSTSGDSASRSGGTVSS